MKSKMASSLLPASSISRTWRRRSLASSTFESAMDSFWHTRQRKFWVMRSKRACNAGSSMRGRNSCCQTSGVMGEMNL